jgi:hypothetical protein
LDFLINEYEKIKPEMEKALSTSKLRQHPDDFGISILQYKLLFKYWRDNLSFVKGSITDVPIEGTEEFNQYMQILRWCQLYASENRQEMMDRAVEVLHEVAGEFEGGLMINCHHNYTELENHFGKNVYLTRKGAIRYPDAQR